MTRRERELGDSAVTHSADGWDAVADDAASPDEPTPFDVDEGERYRDPMLIGAGAMGRVEAVYDRRLDRQVAMKTLKPAVTASLSVARFLREATLTATLDHPAIVSVYDAGRRDDGRLFYTMHLVDGHPLSSAIAEASSEVERERFLRPFTQVCEAVAFAHARGIVHRDLKPSNIMLSGFGQVQVVDWGLARRVTDIEDGAGPTPAPTPGDGSDLTAFGAVIGTPAYMSPEQARGEPADTRTDVWALGAVLYEIVTGRRWSSSARTTSELPPELAAIADKALADDPADRYHDASALAEDLASYLDGGRVGAHSYSAWALLARLYRTWRAPILVAATAIAVLVVGGLVSYQATVAERDRAVAAEAEANLASSEARAASARADGQLARTLSQEANRQLGRHDPASSSILAGESLLLDPSAPATRGVWASVPEAPRARMTHRLQLPADCRPFLSRTEPVVACVVSTGLELWDIAKGELRWSVELQGAKDASFIESQGAVYVYEVLDVSTDLMISGRAIACDLATGDERWLLRLPAWSIPDASGRWLHDQTTERVGWRAIGRDGLLGEGRIRGCRSTRGLEVAALAPDERLAVLACKSELSVVDLATGATLRSSPRDNAPALTAGTVVGDRVLFGTVFGDVIAVDWQTGDWGELRRLGRGLVGAIDVTDDGRLALIHFDGSALTLLDPQSLVRVMRWPERLGTLGALARDGRWMTLVNGDRVARRFALQPNDPARGTFPVGTTSVAWSPGGQTLAATSRAVVHAFDDVGRRRDVEAVELVKHGAFSLDGQRFYGATLSAGIARWSTADWRPLPELLRPGGSYRWVHALADRWVIAGGFTIGVTAFHDVPGDPVEVRDVVLGHRFDDAAVTADGRLAAALSKSDGVYRITVAEGEAPEVELLGTKHGVSEVAPFPGGDLALTTPTALTRVDGRTLSEVWSVDLDGRRVFDVAVSPDGRLVATGERQGTARLWSALDGTLVADLRGHDERVVSVAFDPSGRRLATGSWDRSVRRWDLTRLADGPVGIRRRLAEVEAAWDLDLTALLAR